MTRYPDIEIYILNASADDLATWLSTVFEQVTPSNDGWHCLYQGKALDVQFTPKIQKNFSSLWFKQNHTPWLTDLDCARAAHAALSAEVRCQDSSWQEEEGETNGGWIKLIRGEEKSFEWI